MAFGKKAATRPEPILLDGIWGSPDGVVYKESRGWEKAVVVEEYKCTAIRSDKSPADNWRWMMQVKGYCKMVGVTKCVFRVFHHMDIFRDPEHCYRPWEIVFTQAEIDENWQAILNQAKVMEGE